MVQKNHYGACRGFTLVEIIVVVIVLGIAAAVGTAMIGNTDALQVRAATQQLVASLSYAQNNAITQQKSFAVVFNSAAEEYEVQDEIGNVVPDPVKKMAAGLANPEDFVYRVNFPQSQNLSRVVIEAVDFDGTASVWFDYLGQPHAGTPALGAPALIAGSVRLGAGTESLTITVEPVTGHITVN